MSIENIPAEKLQNVVNLARLQLDLAQHIETAEMELGALQDSYKHVSETELPDAMASIEMKELTLQDGSKIKIEPFYGASITKENQVPAFNWLKENGHESLIKHDMVISFGKGQEANAVRAADLLKVQGIEFSDKMSVHAQTLKAFVREQLEDGAPLPMDLFSVHVGNKTIIKKG